MNGNVESGFNFWEPRLREYFSIWIQFFWNKNSTSLCDLFASTRRFWIAKDNRRSSRKCSGCI